MGRFFSLTFLILFMGAPTPASKSEAPLTALIRSGGLLPVPAPEPPPAPSIDFDTTSWFEFRPGGQDILLDIRYASEQNFVGEKMYNCGRCFLRPEAGRALLRVQDYLKERGYRLLLLDCYRPKPFQQRLWDKVPDRRYVTPPAKGSMHNRGLAVDLTLADSTGKELDMGTPYDFFGKKAWSTYTHLPDSIIERRQLLRTAMEQEGFSGIRTEWWHFSYRRAHYRLDEWLWACPTGK